MSYVANWSYPNAIRFGCGRISELPEACQQLGLSRPLFVTDRGLSSLEITHQARGILEDAGLGHAAFMDVDPNPHEKNLEAGLEVYRHGGHDGIVAFGGGSALDLGKLIAFMHGQTRPVWDFEDLEDWWTRADADKIAPIIAVPTTAGTGSEVGRAGVLTNSQTQVKKVIFHPQMLPSAVICDPELTTAMPKVITIGTGMDAFVHCLEAYCAPHYHPMSAGIALEGMRLVKEHLPSVVKDPADLPSRAEMMSAAAMGAVAFQKGLGAIHALSHPAGSLFHTHHGMTNAVVMPHVLRFNRDVIETGLVRAARYLDIDGSFDGFLAFVEQFLSDLEVPERLSSMGVDANSIDQMAAMAIVDPTAYSNPKPLSLNDAKQLYTNCV